MRVRFGNSFTALEVAILAVTLLLVGCYIAAAGHLTKHMLLHIGLMAVLAPLAAMVWLSWGRPVASVKSSGFLAMATVVQLGLFFLWHSPRVLTWLMESHGMMALAQGSLFIVATAFWLSVLQHAGNHVWRAIVALLLTGKLFCLLALLLVFAPRALYAGHDYGEPELVDQQLAGLLMITACPMTYILAAVLLVVRWLRTMEEDGKAESAA
ncbi:cytochrome c oxidase assembly protein [Saccharophagus sp. K07]|uniref:cytochrome c oxidase assembly protein n=1 Tax=Saccharophagus sp. K07 TaxID=2283636 RepID=UPI001652AE10|nr:cytochrome c oxidase assembly protein [Saccharophagus sp. K07]